METDDIKHISIGVTGHRKLSPQQLTALEPIVKKAIENIIHYHQNVYNNKPRVEFASAIAIGADTLFANIALIFFSGDLKIYLPFEKEEYLKDFETPEDKEAFENLVNDPKVKKVTTLNKLADGDRDNHYLNVGQTIVDDTDYLIAIWDEQKAKGTGGTAEVVEYARTKGKNVLVINPDDEKFIIKGNYLPHLNDDVKDKPKPATFSNNIVEDYYKLFDKMAVDNRDEYRNLWEACFAFGVVAAIILALKVAFSLTENIQFLLTILEIVSLSRVVYLIWKENKEAYHQNYLQYRFIAERLRMNNLLYLCGYYPIKTETRVIHKAMREIESKYPVDMINKIVWLTAYSGDPANWKKEFVRSFAIEQANYHKGRIERLEEKSKENHHIKIACLVAFAIVVLFHVVIEFRESELSKFRVSELFTLLTKEPNGFIQCTFFLYLLIPTILARYEAVKYLRDWERLISQSTYMNEFFSEISGKIHAINEDDELYALLVDLNDNIYLENLDWEMFMVNKNEEIT
jgi:hypothetical protein